MFFESFGDGLNEGGAVEGFFYEIVGAEAHGFDGFFNSAVAGDDDDFDRRVEFFGATEDGEAVLVWQGKVGDDEIGAVVLESGEGGGGVIDGGDGVVFFDEYFFRGGTEVFFVVNKKDFSFACHGV